MSSGGLPKSNHRLPLAIYLNYTLHALSESGSIVYGRVSCWFEIGVLRVFSLLTGASYVEKVLMFI